MKGAISLRLMQLVVVTLAFSGITGCGSSSIPSPPATPPAETPAPPPSPSPTPQGTQPPTIASLSPASVSAGAPGLTLTIEGANFIAPHGHTSSRAIWTDGPKQTFLETIFVSSTKLKATVPAELLTKPTTAQVHVETGDSMSDAPLPKSPALPFKVTAPPPPAPSPDSSGLNGNWIGTFVADMGPEHSVDAPISGPLRESGGVVGSTTLKLESSKCFDSVFVRSGTLSGHSAQMEMIAKDFGHIQFSGTLSNDELGGTFEIEGSECGSGPGTLAMIRIPSITGTWRGALRSSGSANDTPLSLSLTQTASITNTATGPGVFKPSAIVLSGMLQSAESACLSDVATSSPSLVGALQGTTVEIHSSGSPSLVLDGSLNLTATSLKGTYRFSGTSCDGETGAFELHRF